MPTAVFALCRLQHPRAAVGSYRLSVNSTAMKIIRRRGQPSIYRLKQIFAEREHAVKLYKTGLSMKVVAAQIGKSTTFVWNAVHGISTKTKRDER